MDASCVKAFQPKLYTTVGRIRRFSVFFVAGFGLEVLNTAGSGPALSAQRADFPVLNGDVRPCTADFTFADIETSQVYDAKIHVTVFHDVLNKRKYDLEIGTNCDGKARFEGLPDKVKKAHLECLARYGEMKKSLAMDLAAECHSKFTVVLGMT